MSSFNEKYENLVLNLNDAQNNYRGESYVGRLTKTLSNLKLIKVG